VKSLLNIHLKNTVQGIAILNLKNGIMIIFIGEGYDTKYLNATIIPANYAALNLNLDVDCAEIEILCL
jgi:hypothetical protein